MFLYSLVEKELTSPVLRDVWSLTPLEERKLKMSVLVTKKSHCRSDVGNNTRIQRFDGETSREQSPEKTGREMLEDY